MTCSKADRENRRHVRGRAPVLTDTEAQKVRSIYLGTDVTKIALARRFGVSTTAIDHALKGVKREAAR
jgi:hypothetical protein